MHTHHRSETFDGAGFVYALRCSQFDARGLLVLILSLTNQALSVLTLPLFLLFSLFSRCRHWVDWVVIRHVGRRFASWTRALSGEQYHSRTLGSYYALGWTRELDFACPAFPVGSRTRFSYQQITFLFYTSRNFSLLRFAVNHKCTLLLG